MTAEQPDPWRHALAGVGLSAVVWAAGWVAMVLLDGQLDLANLALIFVLTSVLAALWLPAWLSVGATIVSALAFNWVFVPPRGAFSIGLHQHAVLLLSMGALSVIVALLVARLRRQAAGAARRGRASRTVAPLGRDVARCRRSAGAHGRSAGRLEGAHRQGGCRAGAQGSAASDRRPRCSRARRHGGCRPVGRSLALPAPQSADGPRHRKPPRAARLVPADARSRHLPWRRSDRRRAR